MNNYFESDEEEIRGEMLEMFNYKEDSLYNKGLDIKCNFKIGRKDNKHLKVTRKGEK